ncbi:MAG: antitoxin [Bacteroidetes bacterium RIFOXYA12_FULL_35_11]|nr:MAG: antitoxin [Bacteroidetes bacterium GWF2_35_48]OFY82943.1 MAG: antitoxin [Bacteroidetes bacterium RIFOXYA12_FULL_35_11]OFY94561.1 MAG: antitoxin [Bacteroidetes bacterium RIFOXYB2_FULL_35_7]OFZ01895.1 MAG: antitoxin [Bacteroidetes bacterium RIFOXYC12_FULL_35_7]HBX52788.1 type II toxin-antitoxin system ParD family antitoxin [Bacteroidales bacterium]
MNRNTSISLGSYFDKFVQGRVITGRYNNVSEVIRAGLRLLEEEENKMNVLKEAIQEGIDSGIAKNFNPERHLKLLKSQNNG